jgi:hypothetical protein
MRFWVIFNHFQSFSSPNENQEFFLAVNLIFQTKLIFRSRGGDHAMVLQYSVTANSRNNLSSYPHILNSRMKAMSLKLSKI